MKRYISLLLCAALALCLCACQKAPDATTAGTTIPTAPTETTGTTPTNPEQDASAIYDAPMASVSMPLTIETQKAENDTTIAYYTHQDVSLTLPDADVAGAIMLDLLNRIDKTRAEAENVFTSAKADYNGQDNWYPYSYAITYQSMRLDQNVLSFFGTEGCFDGSPRSMSAGISITYDLTTGEPLSLRGILHEENYADTLCDLIIAGLKNSKSDNLFSDYESIIRAKFSTNVPVESWYFSEEGLCFYFAPYEIAAYTAGTVVSEIPYASLNGLLKDQYYPGESLEYSGALTAKQISQDDTKAMDAYSQFAEVILDPEGEQILIATDGSVSNIRVNYAIENAACGVTQSTVLTLAGMGPTDAIILTMDDDALDGRITITFDSFGQAQTLTLTEESDGVLKLTK